MYFKKLFEKSLLTAKNLLNFTPHPRKVRSKSERSESTHTRYAVLHVYFFDTRL